MANLFTSQTPVVTDASDGSPGITTGTTIVFATAGNVTGVRFYATATVSGTYTVGLWSVDSSDAGTGTLLASKTMSGAPTGGTWNTVTFDAPVAVTASTVAYRVGVFSGAGRYVATVAFPDFAGGSGGLTNGSIFAPPNNDNPVGAITIKQGVFTIDAAFAYPTGGSGGSCYFVDVEFSVASGDSSASPNGLSVPVSLGAPTASFSATAAVPTGIEVPVTLGAPSSAFSLAAVTPTGIAVPVSLGAPAVYHYVRPDGLSVPITLGAPSIEAPPGPAPTVETGSWFGLLAAVQSARSDAELNRERERNPVECPYDGWPLTPTDRGLHCEFGGHIITPKA
jgi:hypothetical protein